MITGAALLAFGGMAHAADAAGPLQTATPGAGAVQGATPIKTVTAAADASAGGTTVTEIVVTGSRIPAPNLTSVSPIQAIGHEEFQLQGATDAIDLLNTLPQNFQNSVADFSNTTNPLTSPGGVTTADLRGLGPQRTLVLVNGRRLGLGDPNTGDPNPAPDLDQIPVALIDHVEVLTGGASATYGSDAVGGVVNFIMKKDFEGVQLDGTFGIDQHTDHNVALQQAIGTSQRYGSHWDGKNDDFSVLFGANAPDDKGNVTGYFEFRNAEPVTEGQRDYSGCLMIHTPAPVCANTVNSNQFIPIADAASGTTAGAPLTVLGTSFLPWPQAGSSPPSRFNSSPYEYLSRQDTRYLAGFFAHYDVTSWFKPYSEFMFMHDTTTSAIGPSGLFEGGGLFAPGGGFYVNCGNPLLSAQETAALGCTAAQIADPAQGVTDQKDLLIGRRNIEGGPRNAFFDHTNYRIVLGAKGDINDAWTYDAYGSYYFTSLFNSNGGYLSLAGIQDALLVGGTAAAPVCLSGNANCVPYNIFNQGGVTPAQTAALTEIGTSRGSIEEQIFEGYVDGDLGKYGIKTPWADDGVSVSIGLEHRWDHLEFQPDTAELSGDLSGFAGASVAVNNAISVQEEYFETRIPIVQKRPWFEDLSISGGYRYSDYSTSGGVSTYKVGGEWAPTPDIRFRGSYDRAIRAASILEAFTPQSVTNTSAVSVDPCAPTNVGGVIVPATATLAQCMHTGVTAAEYGNGGTTDTIVQCPAGQCAILQGGNPHLAPEIADTWSIGATVTPSFLHGFTGSIDYWDITVDGEIGSPSITTTFNDCLLNGTPSSCASVVRTPQGFLFGTTIPGGGYVIGLNANVGQTHTTGLDFQGDYRLALEDVGVQGMGSISFHFVGTYQLQNGLPGQDCSGLFGPACQTDNPKWRHTFRVTWNTPWNVLASLQWRYLSATQFDNNSTQPGLQGSSFGAFDPNDNILSARNYLDLSGAWRVNTHLTIRGGINNILDQDPPLLSQNIAGIGAPNTYPTYDLLGRQFFVSATAKF
ncbi:MAG TPA: TonB-dependent receptor [Caulobacteraceae bacterium]|nr:TonB-dependent receptor [Caulobacteraceae bacterium]